MFSVEFTIGRRSLPPRAQSEEAGCSGFCDDAELRYPSSTVRSGAKPPCKEMGQDQNAQIRQPLFRRLLSGRWCRG